MDSKSPAPLKLPLLLTVLCAAVMAFGTIWAGWDMFGPKRKSILQGWDDSFYYFWLPSVVIDHDVDFTNQIQRAGTLEEDFRHEALAAPRTPTGLVVNKYPPGWALGSLPFFAAVRAVMPAQSDGFEPPYLLAVWAGQLLYAIAGLWLAVRILERFFAPETARVAVLAGWLASPLVYYQSARLAMSHSQVFALVAATSWLALRILEGDTRRRTWALLGFSAALLVVTRNVALVYLALPAYATLRQLRRPAGFVALAAGAAGPLLVQVLAWRALFGSWLTYSYGGERFDFAHLHLVEVLFSPRHGWFYWHPAMALGGLGFAGWSVGRAAGRAWLVSLAAIIVLNAAWPVWWLGSSFGQRGFEAATLFAMVGLAVCIERWHTGWPRRLLVTALGGAIVWNLVLLGLFLDRRIDRGDAVTYADSARALFHWIAGGP